MNLLMYVQLRGIVGSTGHGRVARQITEHLLQLPDADVCILADQRDHHLVVPKAGSPWTELDYRFFRHETSLQQAQWIFGGFPVAEHYWPDVDVVYCCNHSFVPTRAAPLVVTMHDAQIYEPNVFPRSHRVATQRLKSRIMDLRITRKAALVHTVSQFAADRIAHYHPQLTSRLRVIPNGVAPAFFEPVSAEGLAYLESVGLAGVPFILVPGGLNHRKNARLVLDAWPLIRESHPDVRLVVVGHNELRYASEAGDPLSGIILAGFVSDEALVALYGASLLVWFSSLYEGFGLPVLEAMACGSPVVTSNTSSLPEVAGAAALKVAPWSVAENVEAVRAMLDDPTMRTTFVELGRARAQQYTWKRCADQLWNEFKDLA